MSNSECLKKHDAGNGNLKEEEEEEEEEYADFPELDMRLTEETLIQQLSSAAASWGFFRISHHGIPQALLDAIAAHSRRFFLIPSDEKLAIAKHPNLQLGYTPSSYTAAINSWSETLHVMPGAERIHHLLAGLPSLEERDRFSKDLNEYFSLVEPLSNRILRLLFKALEVDSSDIFHIFSSVNNSTMRINYYPPCPFPIDTYGVPAHKDFGGLAILYQDVPGLEIFKDEKWIPVKPDKEYLVVNIGETIQVLSNGKYKSMLHRSLVWSDKSRLSYVFFHNPSEDSIIAPFSNLVTKENPAKHRTFSWKEYRSMFRKAQLAQTSAACFFEVNISDEQTEGSS